MRRDPEAIVTSSLTFEEPITGEWDARQLSFEAEALIHLDALYRVALRFVGNAADADDLVQDTLLRAYQAWDHYEQGTNAKGWLITILRNLFINAYRRSARRRQILEAATGAPPESASVPFFDNLVDDEVTRAIDALPLSYREVVVLRDIEDLHYKEIATMLGVPVGTVKSRLFRAREMLQEQLLDYAVSTGLIKR
jgi:RNA polymerase sigma-70 factor (ECF subfamily)